MKNNNNNCICFIINNQKKHHVVNLELIEGCGFEAIFGSGSIRSGYGSRDPYPEHCLQQKFLFVNRSSPLRMEILQDRVQKLQKENGQRVMEVTLILDVKTRWNSMIAMLDSFFKVKDALISSQEVFNDLKVPTETELRCLEDLVDALRPVEMLTKRLCEANFDVLKADIIFRTCFNALRGLNSAVADTLLKALKTRYGQRRNAQLLSVLKFLSDPVGYTPGDEDFEMPQLREAIKDLYQRLFPEDVPPPISSQAAGGSASIYQAAGGSGSGSTDQEVELTYQQRLTKMFDADLKKKGSPGCTTSQVNFRYLAGLQIRIHIIRTSVPDP